MSKRSSIATDKKSTKDYSGVIQKLKDLRDPLKQVRLPPVFLKLPSKRSKSNPLLEKLKNPIDFQHIQKQADDHKQNPEKNPFNWEKLNKLISQIVKQVENVYSPGSDEYRNIKVLYQEFLRLVPANVAGSIPNQEPSTRTMARKVWEKLRFTKVDYQDDSSDDEEGQFLCDMFLEIPDRDEYPEYYETIKSPIDLTMISKFLETGKYDTGLITMTKDVEVMVKNCEAFNEPDSQLVIDAIELQHVYKQFYAECAPEFHGINKSNPGSEVGVKSEFGTKIGIKNSKTDSIEERSPEKTVKEENTMLDASSTIGSKFKSFTNSPKSGSNPKIFDSNPSTPGSKRKREPSGATSAPHSGALTPSSHTQNSVQNSTASGAASPKNPEFDEDDDITQMLLEEDENGKITYPFMPAMADIFNAVIGYTMKSADGGFTIHGPFMSLPPRDSYPDYFEKIPNPLSLEMVKERLEQQHYNQNIEHLCHDLMLIFQNAKRYNEPGSDIHTYAMKLEGAVRRKKNDLYNKHGIKKEEYVSPYKAAAPFKRRKLTPSGDLPLGQSSIQNFDQHSNSNSLPASTIIERLLNTVSEFKSNDSRKLAEEFMELPEKEDFPDYYKVVEKPIDLNSISADCNGYDINEFLSKMSLLFSNARQYNEPGSGIYNDANQLENVLKLECRRLNVSKESMIRAGLERPNRPVPEKGSSLESQIEYFMDELLNHRDPSGKVLAVPFQTLPSKTELPDYYKVITKPIDIDKLQKNIENTVYTQFNEFMKDAIRMLENCCVYNENNSILWNDSILLMRFAIDLGQKILKNVFPAPRVMDTCQSMFMKIFDKMMNSGCSKTKRKYIDSLRADIQLNGAVVMPLQGKLPPEPSRFPTLSNMESVKNNSGCLPDDPSPTCPNFYVATGRQNPQNNQPEMRRQILNLPSSLDHIYTALGSYLRFLQNPNRQIPANQIPRPKYPRLDILQQHVFTILRGHRSRTKAGSQLFEDTFCMQEEWLKARDELVGEQFHSPSLSYGVENMKEEKEAVKAEDVTLPGIQGIALILSQAVQQTEATQRVQTKLNKPNCPKICALVPTLQKDHYLPATFPNELEFNRTERQFITTVGDVPNELVIVGNQTLEVPDFDQVFGTRTSATICTADSFCNETADYPVETLYMDKTSLYFAKFERIERDEPLPRRQQQVLMPRMPCYTGQRAGHRIALPQPEADMLNCVHEQMQFKRHYPTIINPNKPTNGIGQKEKEVADQYFHQINFAPTSGLKVGDVVLLRSDKSNVMSKIVRLWTRKDQPNQFWGTGTHLKHAGQVDHEEWMTWYNKEVFRVASASDLNNSKDGRSTETVQVQFSVNGAVRTKAYVMSKTDYMEMRPNAQDRDVFFCERNYIEPRRQIVKTESGEEQKTFPPTFRMVNGAKKRYIPTEKLVDDEMFHFPEDESNIFKSFLLPSPKLEKAYAEEIRKRQIEVQGIQNQPPVQPYQTQTATTPVRPMQPQMQAGGPGLAAPHGAQAPGVAHVRPGMQPHRGFPPGQMQGPYGRAMPPHMVGGRPGMPIRAPGPYNAHMRPGMPPGSPGTQGYPSSAPSPPVNAPSQAPPPTKKKKQKLATTAYVLYSAAVHSKLRNESPHSSFGEISKMIGERWRGLPEKDRKQYEDQARANAIKNKEEEAKDQAVQAQDAAQNAMNQGQSPLSPMETSNQSAPTPPPQNVQNPQNVRVAAPPQGQVQQGQIPVQQGQVPGQQGIQQNMGGHPVRQEQQVGPAGIQYTKVPTQRPPQARPIMHDYEYPESSNYEAPKRMDVFINPAKSRRQVLYTRMYQNYIQRLDEGKRTISDFNAAPVEVKTKAHYDDLPHSFLGMKKFPQYQEEGIIESLDTLRDIMLRSSCSMKHSLS